MFKLTNPHPQGKLVRDCVKRAITIASEINYHDVAIMLNRFRDISGGNKFNSNENWKPFVEQVLLGEKNKGDMQHEFYGRRYTVDDWARYWENDKSILRVSKHLVATMNGNYYDTWDSGRKGVYIALIVVMAIIQLELPRALLHLMAILMLIRYSLLKTQRI